MHGKHNIDKNLNLSTESSLWQDTFQCPRCHHRNLERQFLNSTTPTSAQKRLGSAQNVPGFQSRAHATETCWTFGSTNLTSQPDISILILNIRHSSRSSCTCTQFWV